MVKEGPAPKQCLPGRGRGGGDAVTQRSGGHSCERVDDKSETLMSHEDRWLLILSVKKEKDKREFLYLCVCVSVCEGVCVDICVVKTNKVYTLQFHKKRIKGE